MQAPKTRMDAGLWLFPTESWGHYLRGRCPKGGSLRVQSDTESEAQREERDRHRGEQEESEREAHTANRY